MALVATRAMRHPEPGLELNLHGRHQRIREELYDEAGLERSSINDVISSKYVRQFRGL